MKINTLSSKNIAVGLGLTCSLLTVSVWAATTVFTNTGSITNTKHNLMQNFKGGTGMPGDTSSAYMDRNRNDYGEVCVYCHTPHGSNTASTAPLWNRTMKNTTYNTYNNLKTAMTQTVRQPGGSSLTCLSCHDGQTAIDSIINMPGAFRNQGGVGAQSNQYTLSGMTTTTLPYTAADQVKFKLSAKFLDTWTNATTLSNGATRPATWVPGATNHAGMNSDMTQAAGKALGFTSAFIDPNTGLPLVVDKGCMACHSSNSPTLTPDVHTLDMAMLGTDLRNDHPVGVTFPTTTGSGTDWRTPTGTGKNGMKYFDSGTVAGALDKADIRIYGPGSGGGAVGAPTPTVECASCHDPHGVPSAGPGSPFNKTFLRVNNEGSQVCLTCHTK